MYSQYKGQCPSRLTVQGHCSCDAEKMEISPDGGVCGSKECKWGCGGVWWSLRFVEVWCLESGGRFYVGTFGRNPTSVAVTMFSHLIYFTIKFYKFCTFNAICKDNAAVNCITLQHKKGSFPSTFTGHTTLINFIIRNSIFIIILCQILLLLL
jgi:hypothetical protein